MDLQEIARKLVSDNKGILAADESLPTIEKRFTTIGLENTHQNRKKYRELLFSTPGIEEFIGGVILFEETLQDQILENSNILSGIKIDQGLEDLPNHPGEKLTKGLNGLENRLQEYKKLGANFTKFRSVFSISANTPSDECIEKNAEIQAEFAHISQNVGLLPIVEPEVLMDGDHSIDKCEEVTKKVLLKVFEKLQHKKVDLERMLLKPNMVVPGKDSGIKASKEEIAERTVRTLRTVVPVNVPGVVFLSGGLSPQDATEYLSEINNHAKAYQEIKFALSFSFGRALQEPVLKAWVGKDENAKFAQEIFLERAKFSSLARS